MQNPPRALGTCGGMDMPAHLNHALIRMTVLNDNGYVSLHIVDQSLPYVEGPLASLLINNDRPPKALFWLPELCETGSAKLDFFKSG